MGYCTMCGSEIPDGQRVCSMCYGDINYGSDNYYRDWAEQMDEVRKENVERIEYFVSRIIDKSHELIIDDGMDD